MLEVGKLARELDRTIHERNRLAISILLYKRGKLSFKYLRRMLGISGGNLSTHLRALERAGYVRVEKRFVGKKPHTEYSLTDKGKGVLKEHIKVLKKLIKTVEGTDP